MCTSHTDGERLAGDRSGRSVIQSNAKVDRCAKKKKEEKRGKERKEEREARDAITIVNPSNFNMTRSRQDKHSSRARYERRARPRRERARTKRRLNATAAESPRMCECAPLFANSSYKIFRSHLCACASARAIDTRNDAKCRRYY